MSEYDHEPIRGLPAELPADERLLWQGGPDWRALAFSALHIRLTLVYFVGLVAYTLLQGDFTNAAVIAVLGLAATAMFILFDWGVDRTTVYTLTDKRLVLRIGVALNKCINIPLTEIDSANLKIGRDGHGDIMLSLKGAPRLGYFMLWPHARTLRILRPQPMLRAIPDVQAVAQKLLNATQQVQPIATPRSRADTARDVPVQGLPA